MTGVSPDEAVNRLQDLVYINPFGPKCYYTHMIDDGRAAEVIDCWRAERDRLVRELRTEGKDKV